MSTGFIPAGSPPPKLGWLGQPFVTVPPAGLALVPGSGLIGRTLSSQLFLDAETAAVAEVLSLFAPGNVSARTLGKWRNRRSNGTATLAIIEANLITPGTTGDGSNFFRVTATDAAGSVVVMPVSNPPALTYYGLDRSGGVKLIDPFTGHFTDPIAPATSVASAAGYAAPFVPTQNLVMGSYTAYLQVLDDSNVARSCKLRCQVWQQNADKTLTLLGTSSAQSLIGTLNNLLPYTFHFDFTIPLVSGTRYFVSVDIFESWVQAGGPHVVSFGVEPGFGNAMNAGQPATIGVYGVNSTDGVREVDVSGMSGTAPHTLNWDQISTIAVSGALPGSQGFLAMAGGSDHTSAGLWWVGGTTSGLAPMLGDITFAVAATGAPVSATSGADMNLRAVMLP